MKSFVSISKLVHLLWPKNESNDDISKRTIYLGWPYEKMVLQIAEKTQRPGGSCLSFRALNHPSFFWRTIWTLSLHASPPCQVDNAPCPQCMRIDWLLRVCRSGNPASEPINRSSCGPNLLGNLAHELVKPSREHLSLIYKKRCTTWYAKRTSKTNQPASRLLR